MVYTEKNETLNHDVVISSLWHKRYLIKHQGHYTTELNWESLYRADVWVNLYNTENGYIGTDLDMHPLFHYCQGPLD